MVVRHGSMLMTEESLVAGCPQAIVPLYLEHLLTTRALLELGVATALPSVRHFAARTTASQAALANDAIFRSAQLWATQHANDAGSLAAERVNCCVQSSARVIDEPEISCHRFCEMMKKRRAGEVLSAAGGSSAGSGPVVPTCLKSVGLGDVYLCVVDHDGAVACRGKNDSGQLGIGGSTSSSDTFRAASGFDAPNPVAIDALGNGVAAIALGDWHICALKRSGEVWCWSQDLTSTGKTPPVVSKTRALLPGLTSDMTDIWAGYFSSCARRKDGSVWCWGSDLGFTTTPKQLAAGCQ
ncbi:MAG TPA: hypothetical protein VGJ91_19685 [Polyangiaceae bacterium]